MTILNQDLSRMRLRKRREMVNDRSLYGTVSNGAPRIVNLATESLAGQPEFVRSGISRGNRLPGPRRRVHYSGAGAINTELVPGLQMDEFIEDSLCGVFASALAISATTISADDSDNSLNGSGGTEFANVLPGQWIKVLGFTTNASNNTDGASGRPHGAMVLSKPSDAKIILAYHTLTTEAAGDTITVEGQPCRNGTSLISSTYEREYLDATTDRFTHYPGQVVNSAEFQLAFNDLIKVVINLVGMGPRGASGEASGKSPLSVWNGQTDIVESAVGKVTDVSNNLRVFRDGGTLSGNLKTFNFTLTNNVEPIQAAMVLEPEGQSLGTASLTGNCEGYLVDSHGRVVTAFGSDPTDFHMMVIPDAAVWGADAPIYVVSLFRAIFNELGDVAKSAETGPAMLNLNFECEESVDYEDVWIQFNKLPTA